MEEKSIQFNKTLYGLKGALDYLDEGQYTFNVKSRYSNEVEDDTPAIATFIVDAVESSGLRIFNLYTESTINNTVQIEIFAEDIEDVVAIEFDIAFNESVINYNNGTFCRTRRFYGRFIWNWWRAHYSSSAFLYF